MYLIEKKSLQKHLGVDKFVRLRDYEFQKVPQSGKIAIFNYKNTNHKVGETVAIVQIIKTGLYNPAIEPILSLNGFKKAICLMVENDLQINQLQDRYFQFSFYKNSTELKKDVYKRYKDVIPNLYEDNVQTVGYTLLEII